MATTHDPDGHGAPSSGTPSQIAVEVGDPACYAHLVCPECGAVTTEGHLAGCSLAERAAAD